VRGILKALQRAGWAGDQGVQIELYDAEKGVRELLVEIDNLDLLHEADCDLDDQIHKLRVLAAAARDMT
jgi:hypothetical protein